MYIYTFIYIYIYAYIYSIRLGGGLVFCHIPVALVGFLKTGRLGVLSL